MAQRPIGRAVSDSCSNRNKGIGPVASMIENRSSRSNGTEPLAVAAGNARETNPVATPRARCTDPVRALSRPFSAAAPRSLLDSNQPAAFSVLPSATARWNAAQRLLRGRSASRLFPSGK